jgi:lipopolysaccharide transport system ATP-binding protein
MSGEDCNIEVTYENKGCGICHNIEIALGIRKSDDTPLLYLGTKIVQKDVEAISGVVKSICKIKRLPLEPGSYLINAEVKRSGVIADHIKCASMITVEGGDFYGTGMMWKYGGFLCDYDWSHWSFEGEKDAVRSGY